MIIVDRFFFVLHGQTNRAGALNLFNTVIFLMTYVMHKYLMHWFHSFVQEEVAYYTLSYGRRPKRTQCVVNS